MYTIQQDLDSIRVYKLHHQIMCAVSYGYEAAGRTGQGSTQWRALSSVMLCDDVLDSVIDVIISSREPLCSVYQHVAVLVRPLSMMCEQAPWTYPMITALTNASCVSPRILARVLAIEVSLIFGIDIHLCRFRFYVSSVFNPLDPHDASKHQFTSVKTYLLFSQLRVVEWKFRWNFSANTW